MMSYEGIRFIHLEQKQFKLGDQNFFIYHKLQRAKFQFKSESRCQDSESLIDAMMFQRMVACSSCFRSELQRVRCPQIEAWHAGSPVIWE